MSAGGAVPEPLPSIWILTFGYIFRNVSAQRAIMLFIVSEPTLLMLPDTPEVFWYAATDESTWTAWALASAEPRARAATARTRRRMSIPPIRDSGCVTGASLAGPGNGPVSRALIPC